MPIRVLKIMIKVGVVFTKPKSVFIFQVSLFVLFILLGFFTSALDAIEYYGINKTVGFAYNYCTFIPLFVVFSYIITISGYGILALFKLKVNKVLSIIQLLFITVISASLFIGLYGQFCIFVILACLISILLFSANMFYGIIYKKKSITDK